LRGDIDPSLFPEMLVELATAVSGDGARRQVFGEVEAGRAVEWTRALEPVAGQRTLDALIHLGHVQTEARMLAEAQTTLRNALTLAERVHGPDSLEVAGIIDALARAMGLAVCGDAGPEHLELKMRALAIREHCWGRDDVRLSHPLWTLGLNLAVCDRMQEAVALFERAVELGRQGDDATRLSHYLESLAAGLGKLGRSDAALAAIREGIELRRHQADAMRFVVNSFRSAEDALRGSGRAEELLALLAEVIAWPEWGAADEKVAATTNARLCAVRATLLAATGRHREASDMARVALPALQARYGDQHNEVKRLRVLLEDDGVAL
jgi:tetratricopeptide (TPR) repeat protein